MQNPFKKNKTKRRIEYFRSTSNLWYFHLLSDGPRGEVIAPSEGYKRKIDMMDTINKYFPEWEVEPDANVRKVESIIQGKPVD